MCIYIKVFILHVSIRRSYSLLLLPAILLAFLFLSVLRTLLPRPLPPTTSARRAKSLADSGSGPNKGIFNHSWFHVEADPAGLRRRPEQLKSRLLFHPRLLPILTPIWVPAQTGWSLAPFSNEKREKPRKQHVRVGGAGYMRVAVERAARAPVHCCCCC